jgi:hypothetical protein
LPEPVAAALRRFEADVTTQVLATSVTYLDGDALPHTGDIDGHPVSFDLTVA